MPKFLDRSSEQLSDTILMIRPIQFGFNEEAHQTNSFQVRPDASATQHIQALALSEFDRFVTQLRNARVNVIVHEDSPDFFTPDSIFPNNWFSTHANGQLITYPMAVSNRRLERKPAIIESLINQYGYELIDLSSWENESEPRFLEGTGSMILDRDNKICYAALSPRSNIGALEEFSSRFDYELVVFEAVGKTGEAIYHTNVMLSVGETFALVGLESVVESDRARLTEKLESTGKELIAFTNEQIYEDFAGNMLQIKNRTGERILVLSQRAYDRLLPEQRNRLAFHNDLLLPIDIYTIEKVGGGSVRCMMSEIFTAK